MLDNEESLYENLEKFLQQKGERWSPAASAAAPLTSHALSGRASGTVFTPVRTQSHGQVCCIDVQVPALFCGTCCRNAASLAAQIIVVGAESRELAGWGREAVYSFPG